MPTSFPGAVHAHPSPGGGAFADDVGFELDVVVSQLGDTSEAVQTKVGISEASAADTPVADTVLASSTTAKSKWRKVATADIATDAVSQIATEPSFAASTTSTSYADATPTGAVLTTVGGKITARVVLCFNMSSSGLTAFLALSLDGAAEVKEVVDIPANALQHTMSTQHVFTSVAAGAHTIKARFKVSSGTLSVYSGSLIVQEAKR